MTFPKSHIKDQCQVVKRLYSLLEELRPKFWGSMALMLFQAIWTAVVLGSMGIFLQIALSNLQGSPSGFMANQPSLLRPFLEKMATLSTARQLVLGFFLMGFTTISGNLLGVWVTDYASRLATFFVTKIRKRLFYLFANRSLSFFDTQKKGILVQVLTNEARAPYNVLKSLLTSATSFLNAMVILSFALMLSWRLSVIVFVAWLVLLIHNHFLSHKIRSMGMHTKDENRQLMVVADEGIGNIKHLKLLNYVQTLTNKFGQHTWEAESTYRKGNTLILLQQTGTTAAALVTLFIISWFSFRFHLLPVSSLVLYFYMIYRVVPLIGLINQEMGYIQLNFPAAEHVLIALDDALLDQEKSGAIKRTPLIQDAVSYHSVCLDYQTREGILKDITFTLRRGETIALVGPSGAGKTSIANLLIRLYEPSLGDIRIDGLPLTDFDLPFLRERIGMVHQDTAVLNMSVRENLLLARSQSSQEELDRACRLAYAHEFIEHLPQGYDTLLGDRGVKLSGGQRQRLQLAQIFLKDPEILILDEATSALDTQSEQYVQKALRTLSENRTTLVIAHRLSTVRHATRILVIVKGELLEEGTWTELMDRKGTFFTMVSRQTMGLVDDLSDIPASAPEAIS